ncbi:MAG: DUF1549 and DUF1553 domain-containing protein [Pirellulaceae bacterium]|nr:DUF1549 and DUF1553 domain-containing protein [Pirellulaceae bacterium]
MLNTKGFALRLISEALLLTIVAYGFVLTPCVRSDDYSYLATDAKYWSYQPSIRPTVPSNEKTTWPKSDIDQFIFEKLVAAGLSPSPDASPTTLFRRVCFDLVGLPPKADEIERFLDRVQTDGLETALGGTVDRLLETDAFGERWGRHWLDVARFAESSGKEANITFPYAWRYRDYVIDCFNDNVPFDRFILEQIAGDLLPYESDAERARLLNATGYLALGPKNLDEANKMQFEADLIDEQIDSISRGIVAHSIACARCHDHRSEPYTMEDYYGLAGIFASTKTYFGTFVTPANQVGGDPLMLPPLDGQQVFQKGISAEKVSELKADLASLKKEGEDKRAEVMKAALEGRDASEIFTIRDALRIVWRSGGIEGQLEKVDDDGKPLPLTMGVLEGGKMIDAPLLDRGDIHAPGDVVSRRLPAPIQLNAIFNITPDQSGRLELAKWLTHPKHPLTSRVFVNRVWHHLLGAGIVSTVDNFESTGQAPSHPELLDHLALQFVDDAWCVKKLIRRIVLSHTYRQSSSFNQVAFDADPDNRLLWRVSKRRLDAEVIRDSMLAVSRELDMKRPDGSLVATVIGDRPVSLLGLDQSLPTDMDGAVYRSVYLPVLRDKLPDALAIFDFAEPSLVTGARETTNVPVQALFLMNSPFVLARSQALAERIIKRVSEEQDSKSLARDERIDRIIRITFVDCLGRSPDEVEMGLAKAFLEQKMLTDDEEGKEIKMVASYCQALFASAEFRNVD